MLEKWTSESESVIKRGKQSISKNYLDGCTLFLLWHGMKFIGHYEYPQDAKNAADALLCQESTA